MSRIDYLYYSFKNSVLSTNATPCSRKENLAYQFFLLILKHYKENKEKGVVFEDLKFTTTKLLNLIQTTFNMLEDKITRRDEFPDFNIINLLKLINTLHTAEFIFEFTNEHE